MIKSRTPILALVLFVFAVGYSFANVVVIPMGADAPTTQWALTGTNGNIIKQSGGVSIVAHQDAGRDVIDFGIDMSNRVVVATPKFPYAA